MSETDTNDGRMRTIYAAARSLAVGAAVFALVVCAILVINHVRLTSADPLGSPELGRLIAQLEERGNDPALSDQIRALDLLARKAFFTSATFERMGAWLLAAGIAVMLAALLTMRRLTRRPPDVTALPDEEEAVALPAFARWLVGVVGLAVVAVVIVFAAGRSTPFPGDAPSSTAPSPGATDGAAPVEPPPSREAILAQWPSFRGPFGGGVSASKSAPVDWDGATGRNVLWQVKVPLPGFNSPVVWGNRVFLTGADAETEEVYCFDADTGEMLWRHEVTGIPGAPAEPPEVSADTGYAAPTVAVDGRRVYATFATGNLIALDFDGNMAWGFNVGVPDNPYGHASSLIMWKNLLLVQFDDTESGNLYAFDSATGKTVWHARRNVDASWASPILVSIRGEMKVVLSAAPYLEAYNVENGILYMSVDCLSGEVGPSPAATAGLIFAANQYALLAAVDPLEGKVVWETYDNLPDVSSPLGAGELVWVATSGGALVCYEAADGTVLWEHEFDEGFYASPVMAGGNVYATDRSGMTRIFKAGREFELLTSAPLGQACVCTPAIVGARIYMRGERDLFCIGE